MIDNCNVCVNIVQFWSVNKFLKTLKNAWCLTSTETIRLIIRDGEEWGREYISGGRGILYSYPYTVTTRMTSALRWAAMRASLMFH